MPSSLSWLGIITSIANPFGCHFNGSCRNPPMVVISGNITLMARAARMVWTCNPFSGCDAGRQREREFLACDRRACRQQFGLGGSGDGRWRRAAPTPAPSVRPPGPRRSTDALRPGRRTCRQRRRSKPPMPTSAPGRWLTRLCPRAAHYCRVRPGVAISATTIRGGPRRFVCGSRPPARAGAHNPQMMHDRGHRRAILRGMRDRQGLGRVRGSTATPDATFAAQTDALGGRGHARGLHRLDEGPARNCCPTARPRCGRSRSTRRATT